MKILPPQLTFQQCVTFGYVGEIECEGYRKWIKTLCCATCRKFGPSDPSHLNSKKGMGTKSIGLFIIPQCRKCHDRYEDEPHWIPPEEFIGLCAFYLVQAFYEGRLKWVNL